MGERESPGVLESGHGPSEEGSPLLYFAYTSLIAPDRIRVVAPGAQFRFIAHLPETRLVFAPTNGKWDGGLPSVRPEPGNSVWGAIFEISDRDLAALDAAEAEEGRTRVTLSAMDRAGKRHEVVTHVVDHDGSGDVSPSPEYMALVVQGSRHWQLPAGWVAGLEEHLEGDGAW